MSARTDAARPTGRPDRTITANEMEWVEFLRLLSRETDPRLTLAAVQMLRRVLNRGTLRPRKGVQGRQ